MPYSRTPSTVRPSSPATEPSTLPPLSAARSTTTEPGRIRATIAAGDQQRRRPAGDRGGGDQRRPTRGDVRREQLALAGRPVLASSPGRSRRRPRAPPGPARRTWRPSTGPRRRRPAARRTPRRRRRAAWRWRSPAGPATPAPSTSTSRGRHGAGRGHEQREEPGQAHRRLQRAAVAGDQRLRGQRVHRLGPGDPRHQLHRERGDPGRRAGPVCRPARPVR